jgi:hypothetical protein
MRQHAGRFLEYVSCGVGDECWLWKGPVCHGYGRVSGVQFGLGRHGVMAHRLAFEIFKGPVPDGLCVCHRCDVPLCVNPEHLWLGTSADNNRDRMVKGRGGDLKGEGNGRSVLSEQEAAEVLRSPLPQKALAEKYGVSISTISEIKRGRKWAHLGIEPVINSKHGRFISHGRPTEEALRLAIAYARNPNITALARQFSATKTTIRAGLLAVGADLRHGNWKPSHKGGAKPKKVVVNGVTYPTVRAAMRAERMGYEAIKRMQEK